jgi:hypothetical protein
MIFQFVLDQHLQAIEAISNPENKRGENKGWQNLCINGCCWCIYPNTWTWHRKTFLMAIDVFNYWSWYSCDRSYWTWIIKVGDNVEIVGVDTQTQRLLELKCSKKL